MSEVEVEGEIKNLEYFLARCQSQHENRPAVKKAPYKQLH